MLGMYLGALLEVDFMMEMEKVHGMENLGGNSEKVEDMQATIHINIGFLDLKFQVFKCLQNYIGLSVNSSYILR